MYKYLAFDHVCQSVFMCYFIVCVSARTNKMSRVWLGVKVCQSVFMCYFIVCVSARTNKMSRVWLGVKVCQSVC